MDGGELLGAGQSRGLEPIVPTENPFLSADGTPQPFVQSNNHAVFTVLDTATGEVTSYSADITASELPVVLGRGVSVGIASHRGPTAVPSLRRRGVGR